MVLFFADNNYSIGFFEHLDSTRPFAIIPPMFVAVVYALSELFKFQTVYEKCGTILE
jgi:hypothetical protein